MAGRTVRCAQPPGNTGNTNTLCVCTRRYVCALTCLTALSGLTKLCVRVLKLGSAMDPGSPAFHEDLEHPDDAAFANTFQAVSSAA